jgi:hypothetical protein
MLRTQGNALGWYVAGFQPLERWDQWNEYRISNLKFEDLKFEMRLRHERRGRESLRSKPRYLGCYIEICGGLSALGVTGPMERIPNFKFEDLRFEI